jgi:UDP-N-acetylmuramate--alanine ligase
MKTHQQSHFRPATEQSGWVGKSENMEIAGRKFHFIGAGGIGMSGLAAMLLDNDAQVTGSDATPSEFTAALIEKGARIADGHARENLPRDTDAVVISAAIKEDNPELAAARHRHLPVLKYARMLGELMSRYEGIAISGTHGKSTTCGWLAQLLTLAGADPSFIVGARVSQLGCSCRVGSSRLFLAEACEYDRSFLNLKPSIGCILNIEQDHLDYYRDEDEIIAAFADFARQIGPGGVLIANGQDPNVVRAVGQVDTDIRCVTYGLNTDYDYHPGDIALVDGYYSFEIHHKDSTLGRAKINIPGAHNILNALAVTAIAVEAGMEAPRVIRLLGEFTGIDRRLMVKDRVNDITVIDDYAHHPTEIRASLNAIRDRYRPEKLWCIFQPHQYSRTRFLLDDFAESFKLADIIIVPDIYFVRDTQAARKEVNSQVLVEKINANGSKAMFIDSFSKICDYLKANVRPGELVVTMGAGDVWKVADEYIHWLRTNS